MTMRVMYLAKYAPHAIKGLLAGSDREAAMKTFFESVGGKCTSVIFTRGEYDVVVSGEVPNTAASMGLAAAVRASGSVSDLSVLEELDIKAIIGEANKAAKAYKPAG
jgi:uncharacterized protein with GYD domain